MHAKGIEQGNVDPVTVNKLDLVFLDRVAMGVPFSRRLFCVVFRAFEIEAGSHDVIWLSIERCHIFLVKTGLRHATLAPAEGGGSNCKGGEGPRGINRPARTQ